MALAFRGEVLAHLVAGGHPDEEYVRAVRAKYQARRRETEAKLSEQEALDLNLSSACFKEELELELTTAELALTDYGTWCEDTIVSQTQQTHLSVSTNEVEQDAPSFPPLLTHTTTPRAQPVPSWSGWRPRSAAVGAAVTVAAAVRAPRRARPSRQSWGGWGAGGGSRGLS